MKILICLLLAPVLLPMLLHAQAKPSALPRGRALSTRELTNQAEVVAHGRVSALNSEWNTDRTRIFTRVRIDVSEFLKGGGAGQSLVVLTAGGEVGDVGEIYSGIAHFRRGEEVIVFARKKTGQDHEIVGGEQGKIPVTEDRSSGAKSVQPGIPLEDFRSEVKSAVQASRPGEKKP